MGDPLLVERVPIASVRKDEKNARQHSKKNLDAIKASLAEFGQQKPIVVDKDGKVLAGNGTLDAALALGWTEIEVKRSDLAGARAKAYAVADNRTAELAVWDDAMLAEALAEIETDEDLDSICTGFTEAEIERAINKGTGAGAVDEDEAPEPPAETVTKPGDLWILGDHRLLCGDSTKAEDVARVMAGEKADLLLSDPPYGMNLDTDFSKMPRGDNTYSPVVGDDKPFEASVILELFPSPKMALWGGGWFYHSLPPGGSWVIWDKQPQHTVAGPQNHFEECWIYPHKKRVIIRYLWTGYTAKEKDEERYHPTQKPLGVITELAKFLGEWGLCVDPFLGSGTTLIAAEQLGRRCMGLEIEPRYVDVCVKRWENLTGKVASRA